MDKYIVKYDELTTEEFLELWNSVWVEPPTYEQAKLAMDNSLIKVSIFDEDKIIATARAIGDKGMCYYIKDVIVRPEYQKRGIGRLLLNSILKKIDEYGIPDTEIFVELCAMPDKIPFYQKCGFFGNEAQRLKMMYEVKKDGK